MLDFLCKNIYQTLGGFAMKKKLFLSTIALFALVSLAACNSDQETASSSSTSESAMTDSTTMNSNAAGVAYEDGNYKVEAKDFDEKGWKEYVDLTLADGKITKVVYNAVDKEDKLKTDDADYKTNMEKANGTYPEKYMKELADQLVTNQKVSEVDAVTGATHSSDNFKKLAAAALDYAEKGETGTHTLALTK